jgi:hypothetical protein
MSSLDYVLSRVQNDDFDAALEVVFPRHVSLGNYPLYEGRFPSVFAAEDLMKCPRLPGGIRQSLLNCLKACSPLPESELRRLMFLRLVDADGHLSEIGYAKALEFLPLSEQARRLKIPVRQLALARGNDRVEEDVRDELMRESPGRIAWFSEGHEYTSALMPFVAFILVVQRNNADVIDDVTSWSIDVARVDQSTMPRAPRRLWSDKEIEVDKRFLVSGSSVRATAVLRPEFTHEVWLTYSPHNPMRLQQLIEDVEADLCTQWEPALRAFSRFVEENAPFYGSEFCGLEGRETERFRSMMEGIDRLERIFQMVGPEALVHLVRGLLRSPDRIGWPDISVVEPGRLSFVEVKATDRFLFSQLLTYTRTLRDVFPDQMTVVKVKRY